VNAATTVCQQFVKRRISFRAVDETTVGTGALLLQWVGGSCRRWQTVPGSSCCHRKRAVADGGTVCRRCLQRHGVG